MYSILKEKVRAYKRRVLVTEGYVQHNTFLRIMTYTLEYKAPGCFEERVRTRHNKRFTPNLKGKMLDVQHFLSNVVNNEQDRDISHASKDFWLRSKQGTRNRLVEEKP